MKKEIKKPRLAVDCRMIFASGIGTYIRNVLPNIINSETFTVVVLGYKEDLAKFDWFKNVKFIELKSKYLSLKEQVELPVKIPRCEIYWAPNINGPVLPTRAKVRITTIHDVNHLANARKSFTPKVFFLRLLIKASILHSTFIITVSHFSKKEIVKYTSCKPQKIHVCPLAVEENFDKNFKVIKNSEKYILFVGNVKPSKNLENALKAFKQIKNDGIKFYIVGRKEGFITGYESTSNLMANLDGRIIFTGHVNEEQLKNCYANAKAFIFPSKYEGFGLPVLEAMKFYIPVIASNAASIPEVGGEAILYFDPDNVNEIREKMETVLDDAYEADKLKYKLHLSHFSWLKSSQRHINLFLTALSE